MKTTLPKRKKRGGVLAGLHVFLFGMLFCGFSSAVAGITALNLSSSGPYTPGSDLTVNGSFQFDTNQDLISLEFAFYLPSGWTAIGATGVDGSPAPDITEVGNGVITYTGLNDLLQSPIAFTLTLHAPPGATGSQSISSEVGYWPTNTDEQNPIWVAGSPDPLILLETTTVVTMPIASAITYGQTLANSTLSGGTGSVAGVFTFTTPSTAPTAGVCSAAVTFTPTDTNNYATIAAGIVAVTVTPRPITVTAANNVKVYDGTTSATGMPTVTSGSLINGDAGTFSETYDSKTQGSGKTLTPAAAISNAGVDVSANYNITLTPITTGVITKRAITVTAANNVKVYDGTTSATGMPTITSGSLAAGDAGTYGETYDTSAQGTGKTLTPTAAVKDSGNVDVTPDYDITLAPITTGVITKRPITVTANNRSKYYAETVTFLGTEFTTNGLLNGDTVTSVVLASAGATNTATPGTYSITASNAQGPDIDNYAATYLPGTLTVNPIVITNFVYQGFPGWIEILYPAVSTNDIPKLSYGIEQSLGLGGPWTNAPGCTVTFELLTPADGRGQIRAYVPTPTNKVMFYRAIALLQQ